MPSVFISYRRTDTTSGYASWIYERLAGVFGAERIFMDVDSLPLGVDFVAHLERAINDADIALVLIGPRWLEAADETGARRLDDPDDFVRLEVTTALQSGFRVIPVLIDGAEMPRQKELPSDLRPLTRRQALIFQRHGGTAIQDLVTAAEQAAADREVMRAADEEQARREAEEQALREAEEQALREAEEQALREAREQALREAEEQALREAEEQVRRVNSGANALAEQLRESESRSFEVMPSPDSGADAAGEEQAGRRPDPIAKRPGKPRPSPLDDVREIDRIPQAAPIPDAEQLPCFDARPSASGKIRGWITAHRIRTAFLGTVSVAIVGTVALVVPHGSSPPRPRMQVTPLQRELLAAFAADSCTVPSNRVIEPATAEIVCNEYNSPSEHYGAFSTYEAAARWVSSQNAVSGKCPPQLIQGLQRFGGATTCDHSSEIPNSLDIYWAWKSPTKSGRFIAADLSWDGGGDTCTNARGPLPVNALCSSAALQAWRGIVQADLGVVGRL